MSYKDKDWLYYEYVTQRRTREEIGEQFGVSRRTISHFIQKYGIPKPCHEAELDVELSCHTCKTTTTKKLRYLISRVRKGKTKMFCSRECADAFHSSQMTGELLERINAGNKRFFSTPEGKEMRRAMGVKSVLIQAKNKTRRTSIEIKMADELSARGIEYIEQHNLGDKFALDFFLPKYGIVIECDGDYWHRLPKAIARDKSKNAYVKACGYSIYRFWESEINRDVEACVDVVLAKINEMEAI